MEPKEANSKCACSGDNLDRFIQPIILSILAGGPSTGYGIVKQMTNYIMFAEGGPDPTGIYRYLKIMKEKGLIEQPATAGEGAAAYRISAEGMVCLLSWSQTLVNYALQIQILADEIVPKSKTEVE